MPDISSVIAACERHIYAKERYEIDGELLPVVAAYFDVSQEKVDNFLCTVFSLVRAPVSLAGIFRCRAALDILLEQIFSTTELPPVESNLAKAILDSYFEQLQGSSKHEFYDKKISIESAPFFSFHIFASGITYVFEGAVESLYRPFCLLFLKAIKQLLTYGLKGGTYNNYALAFRYFFKYMPPLNVQFKPDCPGDIVDAYIDCAIALYDCKKLGNHTDGFSDRAAEYIDMLHSTLVENKKKRPHPHIHNQYDYLDAGTAHTETKVSLLATLDGDFKALDKNEFLIPNEIIITSDVIPPEGEDGGCDDENVYEEQFYNPDCDPEEKALPKIPRLYQSWTDMLTLRYFRFFFDSKYPNLYHLSIVLAETELPQVALDARPAKLSAIKVLSLLLIFVGIAPELLMSLGVIGEAEEVNFKKYPLILKKIADRYCIFKPGPVTYAAEHPAEDVYRPTSGIIRVPLPGIVSDAIEDSLLNKDNPGYFFSSDNCYTSTIINRDDVAHFFGWINGQYNMHLTAHKIASSFFPLFCSRYGFDEIMACYISGRHIRMFLSRLHYVHLNAQELEKEYLRVAETVEKSIRQNISQLIKMNVLHQDTESSTTVTSALSSIPPDDSSQSYGSPFVPTIEVLFAYTNRLKHKIQSLGWDDIITRHNLFMSYVYLCMQFNFAYRSRIKIPYSFDNFARYEHEVVADKLSAIYREERLLPVSDVLHNLASDIRENFVKVTLHLAQKKHRKIEILPEDLFFFFLTDSGIEEFTLIKSRDYLSDAGLLYPFDKGMPRHYVRTYFYEKGICNDFADAWIGHHHTGREALGVSSALVYGELSGPGRETITSMLSELGFTAIAYLPEDGDGSCSV